MIGFKSKFQSQTYMHDGIVTFRGNKKGVIARVDKIGISPYPCIYNVLFVESLKHNLLSISQLCDGEYDVSFNKGECIVKNCEGSLLFYVKRQWNFYKIKLSELTYQNASCLMCIKEIH